MLGVATGEAMSDAGRGEGRSTSPTDRRVHAFGAFELDEETFELREHGRPVVVQPKVLELLILLVRERGRVLTKREIFAAVWPDVVVNEGSLARAALWARRAIRDDAQQAIVTVRGRGLRFDLEVTSPDPKGPTRVLDSPPAVTLRPHSVYAGREREDAVLLGALARAAGGEGGMVWLAGEAGIGKSRTADMLARAARQQGAIVLVGRCHSATEAVAYRPWLQLTRALLAALREAGRPAPEAGVVDALGALASSAGERSGRGRLYDALTEVFVEASRTAPLLVLLEDVHHGDLPSLELLGFFARETRAARILVVATARDAELSPGAAGAVAPVLAEHGTSTLSLGPLGRPAIEAIVRDALARGIDPLLAQKIEAKSGGNPQFVLELLQTDWLARALARGGGLLRSTMDLQSPLRASIMQRFETMPEATVSLLTAAAVIGVSFDVPTLSLTWSMAPDQVVDWLAHAVKAGVLGRPRGPEYRFSHAIVRDALYARLTTAERCALHESVANAMTARWGQAIDERLPALAGHLLKTLPLGDPKRALDAAVRAVERARATGEHDEARALATRALEALSFVPAGAAGLAPLVQRLRAASGD
jgi:predicted ATPase/DNA-binding winged helix-turn-helix (wHTH) protein